MVENSKISIALAAYNGEKYIKKQLESIINQTLKINEIVICDDSTTDATRDIIQSLDFKGIQLRYYKNELNLGPIENFKKAITLCNGDYIALSDQDDIWFENKLEVLLENIENLDNSTPNLVFSNLELIDSSDNIIRDSFFTGDDFQPDNYSFTHLLFEGFLMGCAMLINKKMANEVAKMPKGIIMHDYWIHMVAQCFGKVQYIDQILMRYRSHGNSVTQKEHLSIIGKVKKELKEAPFYLKDNIFQAKLFLSIYKENLDLDKQNEIENFIQLENRSVITKRIKAKKIKNKDKKNG